MSLRNKLITSMAALYLGACGPGGNGNDSSVTDADADVSMDSDVVDSDTSNPDSDSVTNNPPGSIDGMFAMPGNDRSYEMGGIIPVRFVVPSDAEGDSMTASVGVYGDTDGEAGVTDGDVNYTVDLGIVVEGEIVNSSIQTDNAGPDGIRLPGTPTGQEYTIALRVTDSQGGESVLERTVNVRDGLRVKYCEVQNYMIDSLMSGACVADNGGGEDIRGEWEVECDLPMGCGTSPTGGFGTTGGTTIADIGEHTLRIRGRETDGEWTDWFEVNYRIEETMPYIVIETDSGAYHILGTMPYIQSVYDSCSEHFGGGSLSGPVELNIAVHGQGQVDEAVDCVFNSSFPSTDQLPFLSNLGEAHGVNPDERMLQIRLLGEQTLMIKFGLDYVFDPI